MCLITSLSDLLCSRMLDNIDKLIRIEQFRSKICRKIRILIAGLVISIHKFDCIRSLFTLPIPPKPFGLMCRYGEHTPMTEDAKFRPIVPVGHWSRVDRFPCWFVAEYENERKKQKKEGTTDHSRVWFVGQNNQCCMTTIYQSAMCNH